MVCAPTSFSSAVCPPGALAPERERGCNSAGIGDWIGDGPLLIWEEKARGGGRGVSEALVVGKGREQKGQWGRGRRALSLENADGTLPPRVGQGFLGYTWDGRVDISSFFGLGGLDWTAFSVPFEPWVWEGGGQNEGLAAAAADMARAGAIHPWLFGTPVPWRIRGGNGSM